MSATVSPRRAWLARTGATRRMRSGGAARRARRMCGMPDANQRLKRLLESGSEQSAEELLPLVYQELRQLARSRLSREKPGYTLQATALVHEAYLRVRGDASADWEGRGHFFAAAAEAMRRILIDRARSKGRQRRGGGAAHVDIEVEDLAIEPPSDDVLAVHDALEKLEAADPGARTLVNLRYFTGLTARETAEVLGVSLSTVEREWRFIRTFLQDALRGGAPL